METHSFKGKEDENVNHIVWNSLDSGTQCWMLPSSYAEYSGVKRRKAEGGYGRGEGTKQWREHYKDCRYDQIML